MPLPSYHSLPRLMCRALMMPLLVAAITLSPVTTAPSFAGPRKSNDDSNVNALIATLLGLAVVGAVISHKKNNDDRDTGRSQRGGHREFDRDRLQVNPDYLLPGKCLRKFKTQFGKERYWGRNCLQKRYGNVGSLPKSCRETIVAKNKSGVWVSRKVYEPHCMRQAGYRKHR